MLRSAARMADQGFEFSRGHSSSPRREFLADNLPENIVDVCHLLVPPAGRDSHASRRALRPSSALICVVFIFPPVYAPRALLRRRRHDRSPRSPLNTSLLMPGSWFSAWEDSQGLLRSLPMDGCPQGPSPVPPRLSTRGH